MLEPVFASPLISAAVSRSLGASYGQLSFDFYRSVLRSHLITSSVCGDDLSLHSLPFAMALNNHKEVKLFDFEYSLLHHRAKWGIEMM